MTTTAPTPAPPAETPREALTLAIASLAVLAVFLDTTVLFVAFPDIVATFDSVAPAQLSWVLNAYTIVFAALLVPAGRFADRLGHKRAFLFGSTLFTVASMACGLAPSAGILIAFRVIQAIGAATLIPSSLALLLRSFPPSRVPFAVAIWGASGAVATSPDASVSDRCCSSVAWRSRSTGSGDSCSSTELRATSLRTSHRCCSPGSVSRCACRSCRAWWRSRCRPTGSGSAVARIRRSDSSAARSVSPRRSRSSPHRHRSPKLLALRSRVVVADRRRSSHQRLVDAADDAANGAWHSTSGPVVRTRR